MADELEGGAKDRRMLKAVGIAWGVLVPAGTPVMDLEGQAFSAGVGQPELANASLGISGGKTAGVFGHGTIADDFHDQVGSAFHFDVPVLPA